MSVAKVENPSKAKEPIDDTPQVQENELLAAEEAKYNSDVTLEKSSSPSIEEQEKVIKKKYGGILPKKTLISKDHEHAFFDSADWVLGKQKKNKAPLEEALPPKLEPTHNQAPSRRPSYAAIEMGEDNDNDAADEQAEGFDPADQKGKHFQDHISTT